MMQTRLKLMHTGDLVRSVGGVHSVSLFAPTVYTSMMLSNGAANKHENAKTSDKLLLEANVIAMVEKCCFGPAKILGFASRDVKCEGDEEQIIKGMLCVNGDADICVFNTSLLDGNIYVNKFQSRLSPYRKANQRVVHPALGTPTIPTMYGNVVNTFLKGRLVYDWGKYERAKGHGDRMSNSTAEVMRGKGRVLYI